MIVSVAPLLVDFEYVVTCGEVDSMLTTVEDEVAVAVVLAEPPGIADAVHGGVEMFPLDGDQPLRAQQKMVDLAALVAVPPQ